ncbi:MAG: oxidoreductase [Aquificota bacterium]|nr:MAG: oxidoreductase [Aquificota bacterium]
MHVLLVGLGNMGNKYFWKLEQLGERLVLCDIDPSKDKKTHPFYCHFGQVKEPIKAVIVAVDPKDHVSIAKAFLEKGVPVLVEKPPALSGEEFKSIMAYPGLFVSEVESYSVCVEFLKLPERTLRIERFGRGKGYISPLWDLAWHDLYLLQRLGRVQPRTLEVFNGVWTLRGEVEGHAFELSVAWEHPQPRRRWYIDELVLDFGEERVYLEGRLIVEEKRDKLRLMVEDFLRGTYDKKSVQRAYENLRLLESLSHTFPS